jgi:hypothetical protein
MWGWGAVALVISGCTHCDPIDVVISPTAIALDSTRIAVAIDEYGTETGGSVTTIDRATGSATHFTETWDGTQMPPRLDLVLGATSTLAYTVNGWVATFGPSQPYPVAISNLVAHAPVRVVFDGTVYQLLWLDDTGNLEARALGEDGNFASGWYDLGIQVAAGASVVLDAQPFDSGRVAVELVENATTVHVAFLTQQTVEVAQLALPAGCATPYIGSAVLQDRATGARSLQVLACASPSSSVVFAVTPGEMSPSQVELGFPIDELVAAGGDVAVVRSGEAYESFDTGYVPSSFVMPTPPACPPSIACTPTWLWARDRAEWQQAVRDSGGVHLETFDGINPAVASPELDTDTHTESCPSAGGDT